MHSEIFMHYASLLNSYPIELGACWAVIRSDLNSVTVDELASRLGRNIGDLQPQALDDWPEVSEMPIHFITSRSALMTIEPLGSLFTAPAILERLSIGAQIWSVSWNESLKGQLCYARDGHCLAIHDFLHATWAHGPEAEIFNDHREFLSLHMPWDEDDEEDDYRYEQALIHWWAAGMTAIELTSGVRLEKQFLRGPLPTLLLDEESLRPTAKKEDW
ncbi:hypothetical protein SAMN05421505_101189 [Sinosporangium album]|uniref:Uncharacterized protein n=1 Tax=Sinosporangium album TaxID=504805 RepID=A0A1G7QZW1_9ACTN|nr:hypothetical protein [Sinosporangium album]SDG04061.1 hypothetical protein SAMN05421505_101189 [Sinosporangium album]